jgi:hypothetical protein
LDESLLLRFQELQL